MSTRHKLMAWGVFGMMAMVLSSTSVEPVPLMDRGGKSYARPPALLEQGIVVRELPGQPFISACVEDRCVTLKEFRREDDELLILVGPLAKALGLRADYSPNRLYVSFTPEESPAPPATPTVRVGQVAPDFRLPRLDGGTIGLSDYSGRRLLIVNWASWCGSRNDLSIWQRYYSRRWGPTFDILSVATDAQGAAFARPYVQKAGAQFKVALDTTDLFGSAFGLKNSPVSVFVDEVGIVRLVTGGPTSETLREIDRMLAEPVVDLRVRRPRLPSVLSREALENRIQETPQDGQARVELARQLERAGRRSESLSQLQIAGKNESVRLEALRVQAVVMLSQQLNPEALSALKEALSLDPANLRLRRQIWAIEHPDRFYEGRTPDLAWQAEQLAPPKPRSTQGK